MYVRCTKCKWGAKVDKKTLVSLSARKTCPKCKAKTEVTS